MNKKRGYIKAVVLIVAGLILAKIYLKFDISDYITSEQFTDFFKTFWNTAKKIWTTNIVPILMYIWIDIINGMARELLMDAYSLVKEGIVYISSLIKK